MIRIEFPDNRADIALAMGQALLAIAAGRGYPEKMDVSVQVGAEVKKILEETDAAPAGDEPVVDASKAFGAPAQQTPAAPQAQQAAPAVDTAKRDTKGVAFHPDYCANAAEPFYASGSRAGQWKKRKGVGDDTYDAWYAAQPRSGVQAPVTPEYPEEEDEEPASAAAAFSSAPASSTVAAVPQDTGSLMKWISEMQVAQRLSQQQINDAYVAANVKVTDLFPPTPADKLAQNIATVYGILSPQAGV